MLCIIELVQLQLSHKILGTLCTLRFMFTAAYPLLAPV